MINTQEIYDKAQEFMSDNAPPDEIQTIFMTPLCELCDEVDTLRKENEALGKQCHDLVTSKSEAVNDWVYQRGEYEAKLKTMVGVLEHISRLEPSKGSAFRMLLQIRGRVCDVLKEIKGEENEV